MSDYDPDIGTREFLLHTIFITALEGGIGYWAWVEAYKWSIPEWYAVVNDAAFVDDGADAEGFTTACIDAAVIRKGIAGWLEYFKDHHGDNWTEVRKFIRTNGDDGDIDAGDADAIVQFGLFGELVYG